MQVYIMDNVDLNDIVKLKKNRLLTLNHLAITFRQTIIRFTLSIPGSKKVSLSFNKLFQEGCSRLNKFLANHQITPIYIDKKYSKTGYEAYYVVIEDPSILKALLVNELESDDLGLLFNFSIFSSKLVEYTRDKINLEPKKCLLCNKPVSECRAKRTHTNQELLEKVNEIIAQYFKGSFDPNTIIDFIVDSVYESMLKALGTTPTPGVIDANNDANECFTFDESLNHIKEMLPFLRKVIVKSYNYPYFYTTLFDDIREIGMEIEQKTSKSYGNKFNSHKGMIFSLIIITSISSYLYSKTHEFNIDKILTLTKEMTSAALEDDFMIMNPKRISTLGEKEYFKHKLKGIRGEVQEGFPTISTYSLPCIKKLDNLDQNLALVYTYVLLLSIVEDTNISGIGGLKTLKTVQKKANHILELKGPFSDKGMKEIIALDEYLLDKKITPSGSIILLTLTIFLRKLENYA